MTKEEQVVPEVRSRTRKQMHRIIEAKLPQEYTMKGLVLLIVEEILSIPELAIVDREAELPMIDTLGDMPEIDANWFRNGQENYRNRVLGEGWVKEIK